MAEQDAGDQRPETEKNLLVVVTDRAVVADAAIRALHDLTTGTARRLDAGGRSPASDGPVAEGYRTAVTRARRYLDQALPVADLSLVVVEALEDVPHAVVAGEDENPGTLTLLVIDHAAHRHSGDLAMEEVDERLRKLSAALPQYIGFRPSPGTVHLYTEPDDTLMYSAARYTRRWMPAEEWVVAADIVCAFTDSLQTQAMERFLGGAKPSALAAALTAFLDERAAGAWGLHYYTGSVVAGFIDDLERHAVAHGNAVVRGPSEHSLVCSALARWQLDGAPFLITVTSGMPDEFRGTLANLRAARARGFIVCADSQPGQWYPFQGTIHREEDARAVMRARGLRVVHCDRPSRLEECLHEAFEGYKADEGPVVLFVTREVLESAETTARPAPARAPVPAPVVAVGGDRLDTLIRLINAEPVRLLCQVGPLTPAATDLLYTLARLAGIGLADSLTHPGTVTRYRDRRRVPEYLGTLSLYGYSARVHRFLHRDGRLRPRTEQAVVFLGSRVTEADTPFSLMTLRRMRPVQVSERGDDLAPFADLGIVGDVEETLRILVENLDVDAEVLAMRRAAIDATADSFSDVIGAIPVLPMTSNYFFRRMHDVIDGLITRHDYRYTGVFDVGRAGLAAVCNLPRTGPGFSGWYGRALMGDALQALPGVTYDRRDNVLAFTGDGAAALVPDILPTLVHQATVDRRPLRGNLSIFRFVNGSHSVIRTYRETLQPTAVSTQTGVLSFRETPWHRRIGELRITHRWMRDLDHEALTRQLLQPNTINLYSVPLSHNNEGDGLSLLSATGWQRDELTTRTLALMAPHAPTPKRESR